MNAVQIRAYAKLNLTLNILGRRPDGYHELSMVMQSVSLHDTLTARRTAEPGVALRCTCADVPCGEKSLIRRAAAAFFADTGLADGVDFSLESRIPMQAGLGGGSADAAAALTALNLLFDAGLDEKHLCRIGLTVGADVPFCLTGGTRLAKGIGEQLHMLPAPPECAFVLAKPAAGASTAEQFARADTVPGLPHPSAARMESALARSDVRELAGALGNSFEAVVGLPEIPQCRRALLESGALGACMSGSGSTVFGLFAREADARAAAPQVQRQLPDCRVFVCTPVPCGCAVK